MNRRCSNPNVADFKHYGGRGISVCPEWNKEAGPKAFCDWADETYVEGHLLDRKDNDAGYSPENCHWITYAESNQHRRSYKKSSDLPVGVYRNGKGFLSKVQTISRVVYLGTYNTPEEAAEVFERESKRLQEEDLRGKGLTFES